MITEENELRQIIQEEIQRTALSNVYKISPIPMHTQSGTDSPQVDPASLVNSTLFFAVRQTTLTYTQILSLSSTPITIVPAVGTPLVNSTSNNSAIIVHSITAKIYAGTAAYAGANALEFRYTDASGAKVTADIANTFINTTAGTTAWAHVAGVTTALTPVPGKPIVVRVPTANPTTGNGRIVISVYYRVVSL